MTSLLLPRGCSVIRLVFGELCVLCECDWSARASTPEAAAGKAMEHARRDAWCYIHRDLTPVGADPVMGEARP